MFTQPLIIWYIFLIWGNYSTLFTVVGSGDVLTDASRVGKGEGEKGPRVKSQYMVEITQHTIITHTRLQLLETIGKGKV